MKPTKLKSGNWNVRVYVGKDDSGKSITRSVTAPTRKEAIAKAVELESRAKGVNLRVGQAVLSYIEARQSVLSPNTVRSYRSIYANNISGNPIEDIPVSALKDTHVQKWVSSLAEMNKSPKSIRNIYGLLLAALSVYGDGRSYNVRLPQRKMQKLHTPSTEEVLKVTAWARVNNIDLYRAILLGVIGMMRRGEIAALTAEDVDREKCTITINKAVALGADNQYVIKPPKSDASNRTVIVPRFVIDELPKQGKLVDMTSNAITLAFGKAVKKLGLPPFRFHDLRHYAASIAASSSVGASVESIKARGGWATDGMMKRVYINQIGEEVDKDTESMLKFYNQFSPARKPSFVSPLCNLLLKYIAISCRKGKELASKKPLCHNVKCEISRHITISVKLP